MRDTLHNDVPSSWRIVDTGGPGAFRTREIYRRPDGREVEWGSRRRRKGLGPAPTDRPVQSMWRAEAWTWQPNRIGWWIAVLFMVGAALFMLGSAPTISSHVDASRLAWCFFAGSLFFTSAAYLQFAEACNVDRSPGRRARLVAIRPSEVGWWATAVQLVGTLAFNISTWDATRGLSGAEEELLVWVPDVFGSVCFLAASWLAIAEVCHGNRWFVKRRDVSWWVVTTNMVGSVFFGLSAVFAFVTPATGDFLDATAANAGTWLGALCFFLGAYLLLVELGDAAPAPA